VFHSCACDVPAHNYTWSFEPSSAWSAVYAGSGEIYKYFSSFAQKYNLQQYVRTSHQVSGAYWNHEKNGWDVHVKGPGGAEIKDYCDILVNASGILNNWQWPAIKGLERYKGTLLHTANWDEGVKLEGKHVGLIGNG
jgi:cation diffusion facilitator CzcD-associated flavoprotein CzcO